MCARSLQIAFWSDDELTSLAPALDEVFGGLGFRRGIVHRWESLHFCTPDGLYVDVSRTLIDDHAEYQRPIVVTVSYDRHSATNEEVIALAKAMAAKLGIEVFVGVQIAPEDSPYDYSFKVRGTYGPGR